MPNAFQIDYSQDKFGDISDDSHTTQIGTFATRQYINPLFPQNEIPGVLYFMEVYNNIEASKVSYIVHLQDNFQTPILFVYHTEFDESVYETITDDQDSSIIHINKLTRKALK